MRIIILAAGRGERLMPLTKNTPKPLIDMGNGNTLLEEQIQSIVDSKVVDEIVIVVGYLAEQVEAKIQAHFHPFGRIVTVFNPFWHVSNNLMSLWLALRALNDDDVMITNGDNLFNKDVFSGLAMQEEGIWLTASPKVEFDEDDMKIKIEKGIISRVSKTIPASEAVAESPGLAMVRGARSVTLFREQLDLIVRDQAKINSFWLEAFNALWQRGIPVSPWMSDMTGKWQEVDFHPDVHLARSMLFGKMKLF